MTEKREPTDREMRILGKMKARAQKIVQDHGELKKLLDKTHKKLKEAQENDSLMQKMNDYLKMVTRMIANYLNGSYNHTPWQTILMLVAGLLYFITPLDAIPDFIPMPRASSKGVLWTFGVAGLLDDATVLLWLGRCFRDDIAQYKKWEDS